MKITHINSTKISEELETCWFSCSCCWAPDNIKWCWLWSWLKSRSDFYRTGIWVILTIFLLALYFLALKKFSELRLFRGDQKVLTYPLQYSTRNYISNHTQMIKTFFLKNNTVQLHFIFRRSEWYLNFFQHTYGWQLISEPPLSTNITLISFI